MASHNARADPSDSAEEVGESAQGSMAPESARSAERSEGGTSVPSQRPAVPDTTAEFERLFKIAYEAQIRVQAQLGTPAQASVPTSTSAAPVYDMTFERMRKMGAPEFEGSTDPEIAEAWWEKTTDVLDMLGSRPEDRVRYMVSLFVRDALIWWKKVQRTYGDRGVTWADFQREFDNRYRPRMYRDRKRAEFLTLAQRDDQTVADYERRFSALSKYAPEVVATEAEADAVARFEKSLKFKERERKRLHRKFRMVRNSIVPTSTT